MYTTVLTLMSLSYSGNGYIDYDELRTVLKFCMDESTLQFSEDTLDELTRALFYDADEDNSGTITFEELQRELDRHPGVLENLTISAANWLKPPSPQPRRRCSLPHWISRRYLRNNITYVTWLTMYLAVNVLLFVEAALRYHTAVSPKWCTPLKFFFVRVNRPGFWEYPAKYQALKHCFKP